MFSSEQLWADDDDDDEEVQCLIYYSNSIKTVVSVVSIIALGLWTSSEKVVVNICNYDVHTFLDEVLLDKL